MPGPTHIFCSALIILAAGLSACTKNKAQYGLGGMVAAAGQAGANSLVLEEHTAETGIITRLEAFLDMINRRKRGS